MPWERLHRSPTGPFLHPVEQVGHQVYATPGALYRHTPRTGLWEQLSPRAEAYRCEPSRYSGAPLYHAAPADVWHRVRAPRVPLVRLDGLNGAAVYVDREGAVYRYGFFTRAWAWFRGTEGDYDIRTDQHGHPFKKE